MQELRTYVSALLTCAKAWSHHPLDYTESVATRKLPCPTTISAKIDFATHRFGERIIVKLADAQAYLGASKLTKCFKSEILHLHALTIDATTVDNCQMSRVGCRRPTYFFTFRLENFRVWYKSSNNLSILPRLNYNDLSLALIPCIQRARTRGAPPHRMSEGALNAAA